MNDNESKGFNYTYSAKEQAELKKIRDKYIIEIKPIEADKMTQIRMLNASVTKGSTLLSVCIGIIGTLLMGFGMSIIMTDLKQILGAYKEMAMLLGIIIGIAGMLLILAAYPIYQYISEKKRKKVAPEILRLTEELLDSTK